MRQAEFPVEELFIKRHSSRAMTGEALTLPELQSLLEAARWAPSSFNSQPWFFIYVLPTDKDWAEALSCLSDNNRLWAQRAGAILIAYSQQCSDYDGAELTTADFDLGAAVENMALAASMRGLVFHVIGGFDGARVAAEWPLVNFLPKVMVAVGRQAEAKILPADLAAREELSTRKAGEAISHRGKIN